MYNGKTRIRKRENERKNIWNNDDLEFPPIKFRHQTTDLESLENIKWKNTKKAITRHIIFKLLKRKDK